MDHKWAMDQIGIAWTKYDVLCRYDRSYTKINADISRGVSVPMPMFHFSTAGPDLPPGTESNRHRFIFRGNRLAI